MVTCHGRPASFSSCSSSASKPTRSTTSNNSAAATPRFFFLRQRGWVEWSYLHLHAGYYFSPGCNFSPSEFLPAARFSARRLFEKWYLPVLVYCATFVVCEFLNRSNFSFFKFSSSSCSRISRPYWISNLDFPDFVVWQIPPESRRIPPKQKLEKWPKINIIEFFGASHFEKRQSFQPHFGLFENPRLSHICPDADVDKTSQKPQKWKISPQADFQPETWFRLKKCKRQKFEPVWRPRYYGSKWCIFQRMSNKMFSFFQSNVLDSNNFFKIHGFTHVLCYISIYVMF